MALASLTRAGDVKDSGEEDLLHPAPHPTDYDVMDMAKERVAMKLSDRTEASCGSAGDAVQPSPAVRALLPNHVSLEVGRLQITCGCADCRQFSGRSVVANVERRDDGCYLVIEERQS
jgi:hypothetical protein